MKYTAKIFGEVYDEHGCDAFILISIQHINTSITVKHRHNCQFSI